MRVLVHVLVRVRVRARVRVRVYKCRTVQHPLSPVPDWKN